MSLKSRLIGALGKTAVSVSGPTARDDPPSPVELELNEKGEVFVVGGKGLPIAKIDLGRQSESLWRLLTHDGANLLEGDGAAPLSVSNSFHVLSVTAMRRASSHLFPGWISGFGPEQCEQYRSWLRQLEKF